MSADDVTLPRRNCPLMALLGNAFICGVISGPHDRYGAMVWIATFAVLIASERRRQRNNLTDCFSSTESSPRLKQDQ